MAIKTSDFVVNIDEFTTEGLIINANKKTAIRIDGLTLENVKDLDMQIVGNNLEIIYGGKKLLVSNYSKLKYIKTDYEKIGKKETYNLFDFISNSAVDNTENQITAYNTKTLTTTGTNYNDFINASGVELKKKVKVGKVYQIVQKEAKDKGLTLNGGNGSDSIIGSNYSDVIKAGNGNDTIIAGVGNDTITGGTGKNTINYTFGSNNGNDVINLTKGENITIQIKGANIYNLVYKYSSNKKDLIIYKPIDDNGNYTESITLKNFAYKDVTNNATKKTDNTSSVILTDGTRTYNLREDRYLVGSSKILTEKSFTGTWLSEEINASDLDEKFDKKGNLLPYSSKGLTLDGKSGNDKIYGSYYSDTIKGGDGNDEIYGEIGNDTITGGTGENYIGHYFYQGNDVINLTKGENLTVEILSYPSNPITISKVGFEFVNKNRDLRIYNKENESQYFTIKNFVAKDVTNNGNAKKGIEDTSSVELKIGSETYDLRKAIYDIDEDSVKDYFYQIKTEKNYTGSWLNEQIIATETYLTKKVKVGKKYQIVEKALTDKGLSLNGKDGDDLIAGSKYSDTIKGGNDDDVIVGGTGNDKIYGESGKNTFLFNTGDGKDTIYSGKGEDTLNFDSYILDIQLNQGKTSKGIGTKDLIISYSNGDSVTVKDYFVIDKKGNIKGVNSKTSVKNITTYDGTFSLEDLRLGKDNNFYLGTNESETITSSANNDTIIASAGDDTIIAGKGNDQIYSKTGNNTFEFNIGDGNDTINSTGGTDTVKINTKISNIKIEQQTNSKDLIISYGTSDTVTIKDYFIIDENGEVASINSSVKNIITNEDTFILEDIRLGEDNNLYIGTDENDTINGTSNDDIIITRQGNDSITAGIGNDKIYSEDGNNTFKFSLNDGIDTIYSSTGNDTIKFDNTVDPNNISIEKSGKFNLVINYGFNADGSVKDSITLNNYYNNNGEVVSSKTLDFNSYTFELEEFRTIKENYDKIILSSEQSISGDSDNEYIFAKTTSDFQSVVASGGNDEIHTAARNIHLNSGNNKLYLSDAPDSSFTTVHLGSGNDTIYGAETKATNISLHGGGSSPFAEQGQNTFYYRGGGINLTCYKTGMYENSFFSKNGNDLTFTYQNTSLTIKDYYLYNSELSEKFQIAIYDANGNNIGRCLDEVIEMKGGVKEQLEGFEGGIGNDYILGSDSAETINGGAGNDVINPSNGDDKINLGTGHDVVLAGNGNKTIDVVAGNNNIYLGSGNNTIKLGKGADTINSGSGNNTIEFLSDDYITDTYFYANGKDTLTFKGYELSDFVVDKTNEDIVIKNNGNDVITLNDYNNPTNKLTIKDKNNNSKTIENLDTKIGLSDATTSQTITTFDGNDTINTGLGNDILNSGKGENTINLAKADTGNNNIFTYTQGGTDTFVLPEEITDLTSMNFVKDGNNLIVSYSGDSANNTITITDYFAIAESAINFKAGNTTESLKNLLDTYGYDETIYGTANADNIDRSSAPKGVRIYGEGGNDTIIGSAKADYINGGAGADNITGGAGNDTYTIDSANWGDGQDTIADSSGENDTLQLNLTSTQKPFIYFEVNQNGTETNGNANYTTGDDLYINSTGFTSQTNPTTLNGVKIENYFTTGEIENIQTPSGENWITPDLLNKETINKVAQSIANFLKLKGMSSTQEIMNGTDTALKNELSGLYQPIIPIISNEYYVQSTNPNSSEILIATCGMEMRSGNGNDFLYGQSYIEKYLLGNGNKYVYIVDPTNKTETPVQINGTGNYKLFGGEGKPVNLQLATGSQIASKVQNYGNIEFYSRGSYVKLQGYYNGMYENTFCIKENNDLTLKYYNTAITIKDYYLMDETLQGKHYQFFYTENGKSTNSGSIKSFVENKGGVKTLVNDGIGTSANEYIQCSANNDTLTSGGGDDVLRGEAGNDEYSAFVSTDTYIYDSAGNDKLTLSNTTTEGNLFDAENNKQVHILFNVESTYDGTSTFTNDVLLLDNENLELWKNGESYKGIKIKENAIERINSNDSYTITSDDINTLAANVAAWLVSEGREYGSVNDVLAGGNETDINTLITQFSSANWQQIL